MRSPGTLRRLWPYALLVAALLPWLGKPYHVDDPVFLTIADHIRADPTAHPYAVRLNWTGRELPVGEFMGSPPLFPYYLAAVRALGPDAEWWTHLGMLPLALLGLHAVRRLGRRLGDGGDLASALWIASPAVLVSATTVMPDVPVAALTALGAALFLERRMAGAALVLLLACLTRYNALAVLPALGFLALARRDRAGLAALAVPVLGVAAWAASSPASAETGRALLRLEWQLADRLVATPVFLAAASLSPLSLVGVRARRGELVAAAALALAAGLACAAADVGRAGEPRAWLGALGAVGVFALAAHGLRALRVWRAEGEPVDLALWLWVMAGLAIPVLYLHVSAKYLSLVAAPLALLAVRGSALPRAVAWAGTAAWLALALGLAHADAELARAHRRIALEEAEPGTRLGAHWGVQWYAARKGAEPVRVGRPLEPGERLLTFRQAGQAVDPAALRFRRAVRLDAENATSAWPLRMLHVQAHAGWYSTYWGLLPYAVSTLPLEHVRTWRIVEGGGSAAPTPRRGSGAPRSGGRRRPGGP